MAAAEGAGKNNRGEGAASELWLDIEGSALLLGNESQKTPVIIMLILLESTFLLFCLFPSL